jgi:hypothetical protein
VKRAYDPDNAERLRPLLEGIAREIEERNQAIRRLNRGSRSGAGRHLDAAERTALLATHKLQRRLAVEELEALGCSVDPDDPRTVLVPGPDGTLESGYELCFGEPEPLAT